MTSKINIPDFLKLKTQEPSESKTQSREDIILQIIQLTKLLEATQPRGKQSKRNDYVNDVKQSQQNYLKQLNQYTS
jgi:hypothetical protein